MFRRVKSYLVILVATCVILSHTKYEIENGHKCADSVWISTEHDITEPYVIVCRDMACRYACEGCLDSVVSYVESRN